jgi:hypothetical protein
VAQVRLEDRGWGPVVGIGMRADPDAHPIDAAVANLLRRPVAPYAAAVASALWVKACRREVLTDSRDDSLAPQAARDAVGRRARIRLFRRSADADRRTAQTRANALRRRQTLRPRRRDPDRLPPERRRTRSSPRSTLTSTWWS